MFSKMKLFFIIFNIFVILFSFENNKVYGENYLDASFVYGNELASESLSHYVNLTINPCDDFYNYACGKWINNINYNKKFKRNINGEDNFYDFLKDVYTGKFDSKSEAIKKINKMRNKCNKLENDLKNECKRKVDIFGFYAFASFFLRRTKNILENHVCFNSIKNTVHGLKSELVNLIEEKKDIFDKEARSRLIDKIVKMDVDVGGLYLENLKNKSSMEKCYKYFKFSSKSDSVMEMLKNIENYASFIPDKDKESKKRCIEYINYARSDEINLEYLIRSYAFYIAEKNKLYFNPTICNNLCHNIFYPQSLNYGCSGFVIAHEMLHALDRSGLNIDHEGKNNHNLISKDSKKKLEKKYQCFVSNYGNKHNKFLTLDEDTSDNGAIKISFKAFLTKCDSPTCDKFKIPKFEKLSQEQLFFINLARSICKYPNENYDNKNGNKYEGNPKDFRLWKVLSNNEQFAKAFKCKLGTKMNPQKKCEIW
uniref:Peptidase_M13 domain-containing protein n=1 Tax=Strongyloides stercoralis TaxID=6248 RepID=A0A0K0E707_STRER